MDDYVDWLTKAGVSSVTVTNYLSRACKFVRLYRVEVNRDQLQAHHIEPVPRGTFDPMVVHRVENLQTLCSNCHSRLPRTQRTPQSVTS
ncbi:MAG: HNH endonuclease [Nitrososphaerota archaeon]|nr:HNH endonuclease [Nitrososphaerota archaeon]